MKYYKLSIVSLIFSIGTIVALLFINHEIALRYLSADGKTKGLFGIVELISFSYKYYFLITGLFSFIMSILAIRKKETKWLSYASLVISIFSIVSVLIQFWKFLI
jgi:hypothetical protein